MSENETRFSSTGLDPAGDTTQYSANGHSGPGQLLQTQRIALGLTIEQAASQLNLAPRQVTALESDDYEKLPGMASVRGFVRSYAKLLKLDAEPLVAMIAHMGASPLVEPLTQRRALSAPFFDDSRMPAMGVQGPQNKTNLMLPGVIALVVLLFAGFQFGLIPSPNLLAQKPASAEAVAEPQSAAPVELPKAEPAVALAAPAAEAASAAAAPAVVSTPAPVPAAAVAKPDAAPAAKAEPPKPEPVKAEAAKNEPAKAEVKVAAKSEPAKTDVKPLEPPKPAAKPEAAKTETKPAETAKPADVVAPANRGALVIKFSEDTWIDIRKVNAVGPDGVIASRIAKAGTTESFDVPGEVSVTVGNVSGIESATLRGSAVDYKTPAKNNVSRLNLK